VARPEGLEPPAYWFEASRSIRLSYGRDRGHHTMARMIRCANDPRSTAFLRHLRQANPIFCQIGELG
jgi:hypothetical protein